MLPPDRRELLDVKAVCAETREHAVTTRRRVAAGEFGPPLRIGHRLYVRRADFLAALSRFALPIPERAGSADVLRPEARFVEMLRPRRDGKGTR